MGEEEKKVGEEEAVGEEEEEEEGCSGPRHLARGSAELQDFPAQPTGPPPRSRRSPSLHRAPAAPMALPDDPLRAGELTPPHAPPPAGSAGRAGAATPGEGAAPGRPSASRAGSLDSLGPQWHAPREVHPASLGWGTSSPSAAGCPASPTAGPETRPASHLVAPTPTAFVSDSVGLGG